MPPNAVEKQKQKKIPGVRTAALPRVDQCWQITDAVLAQAPVYSDTGGCWPLYFCGCVRPLR
jgi:hypothetical protein